jgi:hypothetical protein
MAAARGGAAAERAVYVLRAAGGSWLTERQRDALWEAFGAPVFTLLTGLDRRILAYECEAQNGLHLQPNAGLPSWCAGALVAEPCECGRPGPRIIPGTCALDLDSGGESLFGSSATVAGRPEPLRP